MAFIRRSLRCFGLDLVWDGKMVKVVQKFQGRDNVIDVRQADDAVMCGRVMEELEDEFHSVAGAMGR